MSATIRSFLAGLRPGQRVFFQGGTGECLHLYNALQDEPGLARGVEFWSCLIPGLNRHDYGALPGQVRLVTFMASPALEASILSGQTQLRAIPYSAIADLLAGMAFDHVLLHTAPPDAQGRCSFGVACDTPALVWPRARRRTAFINTAMPSIPGADWLPRDQIDSAIEISEPLIAPSASRPASGGALSAIARAAAELVPDGCTLQSGIGEAPGAIVSALRFHRHISVCSGIITPDYQSIAEAGAINLSARNTAGIAWGDGAFHDWLRTSGFELTSIARTHNRAFLASLPRFVSIGSAIEVDLAGNLNLEWRLSRRISSIGGAMDYMAAAAASPEGLSIIALPATSGGSSRIVPHIASPTIPGALADVIVTENGVARLKGLSQRQRAEALIAIAGGEHQGFLSRAAETIP